MHRPTISRSSPGAHFLHQQPLQPGAVHHHLVAAALADAAHSIHKFVVYAHDRQSACVVQPAASSTGENSTACKRTCWCSQHAVPCQLCRKCRRLAGKRRSQASCQQSARCPASCLRAVPLAIWAIVLCGTGACKLGMMADCAFRRQTSRRSVAKHASWPAY